MFARSIILSVAVLQQVQSSRLGTPKEAPSGWAWKDVDGHHKPPGHLNSQKQADGSHAWAGKGKKVDSKMPMPFHKETDSIEEIPMNGGLPRKVMAPEKEDAFEPQSVDEVVKDSVTAKYDVTLREKAVADSAAGASTDLQGTLEQDCAASMNLKEFMPKCLTHTKSLIADLDYNYGDAQLETILRNWCQSAKEFPNTRGTRKVIGFRNHQSCTDFADDLKNARFFELKSTSDKGYRKFCTDFYAHHGGFDVQAPPPRKQEPVKSGTSWAGISMVMVSLMLCLA